MAVKTQRVLEATVLREAQAQEGPRVHGRGHGRGDRPWGDSPHPRDGQPLPARSPSQCSETRRRRSQLWKQPAGLAMTATCPREKGEPCRHPILGFHGVA